MKNFYEMLQILSENESDQFSGKKLPVPKKDLSLEEKRRIFGIKSPGKSFNIDDYNELEIIYNDIDLGQRYEEDEKGKEYLVPDPDGKLIIWYNNDDELDNILNYFGDIFTGAMQDAENSEFLRHYDFDFEYKIRTTENPSIEHNISPSAPPGPGILIATIKNDYKEYDDGPDYNDYGRSGGIYNDYPRNYPSDRPY